MAQCSPHMLNAGFSPGIMLEAFSLAYIEEELFYCSAGITPLIY